VQERLNGQTLWSHDVLVYELPDHPEARFCYAWLDDDHVVTVLGVPPIGCAMDAVQSHLRDRNALIARRRVLAFAPRRGRTGSRRGSVRSAAKVEGRNA
jgi:hypothetical protein